MLIQCDQFKRLVQWMPGIVAISALVLMSDPSFAQQGLFQEQENSSLIEPPREVERLLREAEREIEKKNWSVAIKALGLVLGIESDSSQIEGSGQDFFLASSGDRKMTAHQAAWNLFNTIPEEGQKTIELQYGIEVQRRFEQAAESNDWYTIDLLAGKFPMTIYGRQAAYLAAENQIAKGAPAWAALRWERLLDWKTARNEFGPSLGINSASAWKVAGNLPSAQRVLQKTAELFGTKSVTVDGKTFDFNNMDASLTSLDDSLLSRRSVKQSSPKYQGGDTDRNADTHAGLPLPFVAWHSELHENRRHEDRAVETINQATRSGELVSLVPSRSAVVIPPYLVCMTYDQRIHAIHLQTGLIEAVSPFSGLPHRYEVQEFSEAEESRTPLHSELVQRIWGQQSTGQLSADQNNVYAVVEHPAFDTAESLHRGVNAMIAMRLPRQSYNVLQAYSVGKQISLAWEVGGDNGLAEPQLSNVLFLGAPLPMNDELYIIGELNGELVLFALASRDGKLKWKQQLAANNIYTIAQDSVRRNFGCSPSFHSGVLLCPTLSNELIAVDLISRTLLWSKNYERSRETAFNSRTNNWGIVQNAPFRPLDFRSSEITVIADQGIILYAPPDGNGLFAVDAFSGKTIWENNERRVQYIGCIANNLAVISTGTSLVGLDLRSGAQKWQADLKEKYGVVSGRLVRNSNKLFVPTTGNFVVQVDSETGTIEANAKVEMLVGNLFSTQDALFSVSPVSVASYRILDQVKSRLQMQDLTDDPNNPQLIARRAEIALVEGNMEQAFALAFDAYSKASNNADVRALMRKIAMTAIEQDFENYLPRVTQLNELMETGPQRDTYFLFLIRGLMVRQQFDEALDRLTSLALVKSEGTYIDDLGQAKQLDLGDYRQVLEEQWIASTLDRLLQLSSPEAKLKSEARLIESLSKKAIGFGSSTLLERYTRNLPGTASLRAKRSLQEYLAGEFLKAEQLATHATALAEKLTDEFQKREIIRVCDTIRMCIYRDVRRASAAIALAKKHNVTAEGIMNYSVQQLLESPVLQGVKAPSVSTAESLPADQLEAWITDRSTELREMFASAEDVQNGLSNWPSGQVNVNILDSPTFDAPAAGYPCRVQASSGESLEGWHVQMLPAGIQINDPTFRQKFGVSVETNVMSNMNQYSNCFIRNSLVFIQRGGEIIAVDSLAAAKPIDAFNFSQIDALESRSLLWQEMVGSDPNGVAGVRTFSRTTRDRWDFGGEKPKDTGLISVVLAGEYGIVTATARSIQCLDYLTGETLWSTSSKVFESLSSSGNHPLTSNPWLSYHNGKIYLLDPVGKRRLVLDARDGEKIKADRLAFTGEVWSVFEDTFLTFAKTADNQYSFALHSLDDPSELLSAEVPNSERVEVSNGKLVMWGEGGLHFWNLRERKQYSYDSQSLVKLRYVSMQQFGNKLLLLGHSSAMSTEVIDRESEDAFTSATGAILCVEQDTGEPIWEKPMLSYFLFPIYQPRIGAAFVLARPLAYRMGNVTVRSGSIAIVDIKSGSLLYQNDYLPTRRGARFEARLFPQENRLFISYRTAGMDVIWTNEKPVEDRKFIAELGKTSAEDQQARMPAQFKEQFLNDLNEQPPENE